MTDREKQWDMAVGAGGIGGKGSFEFLVFSFELCSRLAGLILNLRIRMG